MHKIVRTTMLTILNFIQAYMILRLWVYGNITSIIWHRKPHISISHIDIEDKLCLKYASCFFYGHFCTYTYTVVRTSSARAGLSVVAFNSFAASRFTAAVDFIFNKRRADGSSKSWICMYVCMYVHMFYLCTHICMYVHATIYVTYV